MRALTEKQQLFVLAMAANPFGTQLSWANAAGYQNSPGGQRVTAHRLAHDPKIQAAVYEVAQANLRTFGPLLASVGLLRIARNQKHPKHMKALEALANRVGLPESSEHTVKVVHTDQSGAAMMERIKVLAGQLGVDPEKLLGVNTPVMIEGKAEEVME
jgi:phage terminase small subunit